MRKLRDRPAKGLVHRNLFWGVRKMIVTANHMRDLHQRVVYYDHVVVNWHPRRTQNDGITYYFIRKLNRAVNDVVKTNRMFRNPQTNRASLCRSSPTLCFHRINRAAFARINRLPVLGRRAFAFPLQLLFPAKTQISLALAQQPLGMFAINRQPVRLPIRAEPATYVRPLVPIQAEPLEVGDELVFKAGFAPIYVGVFDAKYHRPALLPREKPVKERSARVADMQMSSWGGSEAHAYGICGHQEMLAKSGGIQADGRHP